MGWEKELMGRVEEAEVMTEFQRRFFRNLNLFAEEGSKSFE